MPYRRHHGQVDPRDKVRGPFSALTDQLLAGFAPVPTVPLPLAHDVDVTHDASWHEARAQAKRDRRRQRNLAAAGG